MILYPSETTVAPRSQTTKEGIVCDCGILATVGSLVLPAVQLGNSFGFAGWWPNVRLYSREEALSILGEPYELFALERAAYDRLRGRSSTRPLVSSSQPNTSCRTYFRILTRLRGFAGFKGYK